jgi:hypothetical protein
MKVVRSTQLTCMDIAGNRERVKLKRWTYVDRSVMDSPMKTWVAVEVSRHDEEVYHQQQQQPQAVDEGALPPCVAQVGENEKDVSSRKQRSRLRRQRRCTPFGLWAKTAGDAGWRK